jgi:hypothetical protein
MNKLFFSQRILDSLIDEGRITLDGNIITLLSPDRPKFELEPAYRFIGTADGGPDAQELVGKIKYEKDLRAMHAEAYLDSVIVRDIAYNVEAGFIGEKQELMDRLSDTDLLARFLLENLL